MSTSSNASSRSRCRRRRWGVVRKPQMELELHGGRFKKKSKIAFKCFKKIKTKNLYVVNVGIYKPVKSQFKAREKRQI
jgi:hypothetical protein